MSFGDDDKPAPIVPPVPEPVAAAPQFASGMGRLSPKGKVKGGTLLTNPLAPSAPAVTAQRSLIGT